MADEVLFVNVADMRDPNDPAGRSYRQVHAEMTHAIPLDSLVELESGVRLFVVQHTRDCDMTPLYSLGPERLEEEDAMTRLYKRIHGYGEESLEVVANG